MGWALTKSMSGNHRKAMEICDKALPLVESLMASDSLPEQTNNTDSNIRHSKILFKYWHKKATLQKRASSFKEAGETLANLEARIEQHLKNLEQNTLEYQDGYQMLFKTRREQARICSLLRNYLQEGRFEKSSWEMYVKIYGAPSGWEKHLSSDEFKLDFLPESVTGDSKMNMKLLKMVFNRSLRVKTRDSKRGEVMFKYLIDKLASILGTPDTYYSASLHFELVRTSNSNED